MWGRAGGRSKKRIKVGGGKVGGLGVRGEKKKV